MKVGPDAGAGANLLPLLRIRRVIRVAPAPTAVLKPGEIGGSVTGNAGTRKPQEHEVARSLHYAGWWLAVIQPGEDAD
jgi:hypothetical protein